MGLSLLFPLPDDSKAHAACASSNDLAHLCESEGQSQSVSAKLRQLETVLTGDESGTYLLFSDTLDVLHLDLCNFVDVLHCDGACDLRAGLSRARLDPCCSLQQ